MTGAEQDDGWDDVRECASCGDLVDYLTTDDECDGCVLDLQELPVLVPVVTLQPSPEYL